MRRLHATLGLGGLLCVWMALLHPAHAQAPERIAADSARTTALGNTFVAPAGWTASARGRAPSSRRPRAGRSSCSSTWPVKDAASADAAVAAAWAAYKPDAKWPLKVTTPDRRQGRLDRSQAYVVPDVAEREARRRRRRAPRQRHVDGRDLRHGAGSRREARRAGRA